MKESDLLLVTSFKGVTDERTAQVGSFKSNLEFKNLYKKVKR